jgi:hypothetical protein
MFAASSCPSRSVTTVTQSVTQNPSKTNGYRVLVTLLHLLHHFLKNKKQNKKLWEKHYVS